MKKSILDYFKKVNKVIFDNIKTWLEENDEDPIIIRNTYEKSLNMLLVL